MGRSAQKALRAALETEDALHFWIAIAGTCHPNFKIGCSLELTCRVRMTTKDLELFLGMGSRNP